MVEILPKEVENHIFTRWIFCCAAKKDKPRIGIATRGLKYIRIDFDYLL